jgi:hypothetical protein
MLIGRAKLDELGDRQAVEKGKSSTVIISETLPRVAGDD